MKEIDQEEYKRTAEKLVRTKWNLLKNEQHLNRQSKTMAYLLQKGYESALIQELIKKIRAESAKRK